MKRTFPPSFSFILVNTNFSHMKDEVWPERSSSHDILKHKWVAITHGCINSSKQGDCTRLELKIYLLLCIFHINLSRRCCEKRESVCVCVGEKEKKKDGAVLANQPFIIASLLELYAAVNSFCFSVPEFFTEFVILWQQTTSKGSLEIQ